MLGFGSVEIALAYWACILASVFCVAYGALKWNDGGAPDKTKVSKVILPPKSD
jgi:hypothetical protein